VYTVTVTCVDCDIDAPGVGFDGYLGTPSLSRNVSAKLREVETDDLPFGYLYEPLQAILLRPRDLEDMRDFLAAHEEHQVVMWSDTQGENDLPSALVALLARRRVRRAKQLKGRRAQSHDIVCVTGQTDEEWVLGHYTVRCLDCRRKFALDEPETLRAFDPQPLSRKAAGLMLSRWGKLAPDDGWNHALRPAVDPYGPCMEGLLGFLKRHRAHRLEAQLRPVGR
jgi:hypothetical protein